MKKWKGPFFVLGIVIILLAAGCKSLHLTGSPPIEPDDSLRISELDTLYASISVRDAYGIIPHTKSPFRVVRQLAWRSLHVTRVPSDTLFRLVESSKDDLRWFALAGHVLNTQMIDSLEHQWLTQPVQRSGIGLVFGMQGNKKVLTFLSDHIGILKSSLSEYQNALALSRLYLKYPDTPSFYPTLIHHILTSPDSIRHAYLYAAYRGQKTVFPDTLDTVLIQDWRAGLFTNDRLTRQMIIRILADHRNPGLFRLYTNPAQLQDVDVNEANEWVDALSDYPDNDTTFAYYQSLLQYPNPVVVGHLLDMVAARHIKNSLLTDQILAIADSAKADNPYIFVKAVKAVSNMADTLSKSYHNDLQEAIYKNHYLIGDILKIRSRILSHMDYVRNVELLSLDNDAYTAETGIHAMAQYWQHSDSLARDTLLQGYSAVISQTLETPDRGKISTIAELLRYPLLIKNVTFSQIHYVADHLEFPGDIEAFEAITPILMNSYGVWGRNLVDSLASVGYPPYNRFLVNSGYNDIPAPRPSDFPLFRPDFIRLALLGRHPLWKIKTNKGIITVRLNTFTAPATVTLIDSLSRSGAYRNVPFHRVVPNFVIQGGDIERGDGFGGTSIPLPTEPSELEFDRGAAGIASAGPDTEGPQFFFMHQWKPHLDGKYTRFGQVISGMDVVDRIIPGDRVISDTLIAVDQ